MFSKKILIASFVLLIFLFGCLQQQQGNVLTIYTYDSMASEYGLGPVIVPEFEKQCNCRVEMLAAGDAGQVLSRLVLEKNNPKADVVIGIDNSMKTQAIEAGVLEKFTPQNIDLVPENLRFDKEGYLTPYDYGFIAFMYDNNKIDSAPENFEDLLSPEFEKKIIIQNPRTSSPGLALLLWTISVYGDPGYKEYWEKLEPNILTVTAGWDESAGLFAAGEAPMYLSYATSPPYYVAVEGKPNFMAAKFNEGHYIQVEGIAVVKGTKNRQLAEQFIEFSLNEKFQDEIPLHQYMFPASNAAVLPDEFKYAVIPDKQLELDDALISAKQEEWISEWEKTFS